MDRSYQLTLVGQEYVTDELNQYIAVDKSKTVFCSIESIGQREWETAARMGFKPEIRATISRYEYHGEKVVQIDGQRYSVYRTYVNKSEEIELYLERQTGTEEEYASTTEWEDLNVTWGELNHAWAAL